MLSYRHIATRRELWKRPVRGSTRGPVKDEWGIRHERLYGLVFSMRICKHSRHIRAVLLEDVAFLLPSCVCTGGDGIVTLGPVTSSPVGGWGWT